MCFRPTAIKAENVCPECGFNNIDNVTVCEKCGADLDSSNSGMMSPLAPPPGSSAPMPGTPTPKPGVLSSPTFNAPRAPKVPEARKMFGEKE